MRRLAKVDRVGMYGVNGKQKFPDVWPGKHMQANTGDVYFSMDWSCHTLPADDQVDPQAELHAIITCRPCDVAVVLTPDGTHLDIAQARIQD